MGIALEALQLTEQFDFTHSAQRWLDDYSFRLLPENTDARTKMLGLLESAAAELAIVASFYPLLAGHAVSPPRFPVTVGVGEVQLAAVWYGCIPGYNRCSNMATRVLEQPTLSNLVMLRGDALKAHAVAEQKWGQQFSLEQVERDFSTVFAQEFLNVQKDWLKSVARFPVEHYLRLAAAQLGLWRMRLDIVRGSTDAQNLVKHFKEIVEL